MFLEFLTNPIKYVNVENSFFVGSLLYLNCSFFAFIIFEQILCWYKNFIIIVWKIYLTYNLCQNFLIILIEVITVECQRQSLKKVSNTQNIPDDFLLKMLITLNLLKKLKKLQKPSLSFDNSFSMFRAEML